MRYAVLLCEDKSYAFKWVKILYVLTKNSDIFFGYMAKYMSLLRNITSQRRFDVIIASLLNPVSAGKYHMVINTVLKQ